MSAGLAVRGYEKPRLGGALRQPSCGRGRRIGQRGPRRVCHCIPVRRTVGAKRPQDGAFHSPGFWLTALTCLLLLRSAHAEAPKTLLLLASGLSFDDLRPGGPLPHVRELADAGGVALLNTAVAGEPSEAAAYLSVGGGERLAAPIARLREMARQAANGPAEAASDLAAQAAPATETATRALYRRRFGTWPPVEADIIHLGLPALRNVQATTNRAAQVGALGDALQAAGKHCGTTFDDWRAALVLMDRRGVVGKTAPGPDLFVLLAGADAAVVTAADAARLDALCARVLPLARAGSLHVLVAIPAPPRDTDGKHWARLGFVVAAGPSIEPRGLLTSPTTRTPGLVANVDIAPTLLAWQGIPDAGHEFAGRMMTQITSPNSWAAVATLDRQVVATKNATVPVLIGYGTFAIGTGLIALVALLTRRARIIRASRFGLLTAAGALVAFLPVGAWAPRAPLVYGAAVALVSAALAAVATFTGHKTGRSPLGILLTGAALVVALDAFAGSPLVSRALLSGYFLPGIRFYGVGNEYMGLAIGAALIGPLLVCAVSPHPLPLPRSGRGRGWGLTAAFWLLLLVAIGLPFFGANAGGAITAAVTFTVGFFALRSSARLRARHVVAAGVVAILVVGAFALLDRARPPGARTHIGSAVASGQARGGGALIEIAARKIGMNIGLLLTPGAFAALAGLAPIWWLLGRGRLGAQTRAALSARPGLARALPAAGWGAFAAFACNDSGIVAALLLLAPPTAAVIDACLCDSSAWITEQSGSASP